MFNFPDGAAAAILASEEFVFRHGLQENAVEILGMEMVTDLPSTFRDKSCMKIVSLLITLAKYFTIVNKHYLMLLNYFT